ncbi:hypothetical protein [Spirobacillus cienkowskii]|uniref:hypothetical protein n=1 Tax=Spirobacillus cienkowskii TaxID=495820 RepID=UPI0030D36F46
MKQSETIWIENLARIQLGTPLTHSHVHSILHNSLLIFLEELCTLMKNYTNYFNQCIESVKPQQCIRFFETQQPRPGLILLKGSDKMIISVLGNTINVRTLQVHLNSDRNYRSYDFEARHNDHDGVFWRCINDGQLVNPELVAQNYLSSFLVSGCGEVPQTLRLVVATHP